MDELQLVELINKCKHLKYKFAGVYAADNFPAVQHNSFVIVNASPGYTIGSHWTVVAKCNNDVIFADPLGLQLENYVHIYKRMLQFYLKVINFTYVRLQPLDSNQCGLYCIYLAHLIFYGKNLTLIGTNQLNRFIHHLY